LAISGDFNLAIDMRQYLPRSADLSAYTIDDLRAIEVLPNWRPRKRLQWQTPASVFESMAR